MNNTNEQKGDIPQKDDEETNLNQDLSSSQDLEDSPRDKEHLQPETIILDLPDVEDIPGQENIKVPPLGALADTTISSDDEEGKGLWEEDEGEEEDADINMSA
jgi:hypothetical protein